MIQKRKKADSRKAIRETMALRWEPTHVTKPNPRVVPLQEVCNEQSVSELLIRAGHLQRRFFKFQLFLKQGYGSVTI